MRHFLNIPCAGEILAATLDRPDGASETGLLIVSGGNEIRSGAHRGMAIMAQRLAQKGHAVFRFDRRGIGDSSGDNGGFEESGLDIAAALDAFRSECPSLTRIVAFGNCDAASALVLHGPFDGIDRLVLANPWVIEGGAGVPSQEDAPGLPSAAAIRARYIAKLKDPREWLRLLRGGVDIAKLARGLAKARSGNAPSALADRIGTALASTAKPTTILLATGDRSAIEFVAAWKTDGFTSARDNPALETHRLDSPSHSFSRESDYAWLKERLLATLG